jgi:capsular polysaccharide biosynthesis protein
MARPNYIRLITRSWRQLTLTTLIGLVLALAFSFAQPLLYSSSVKLLITQTNTTGLDPYTAIKATERIAQNLAEIIYTSAFFDTVVNDDSVDASYFPVDEIRKRKKWRNTIETSVSPGTGIMGITAYHQERNQATTIAVLAAKELAIQAPNYFGFSVRIQVIDSPLPSRFIARPDFVTNAMFGAIAGILLGLAWVLWKVKE